MRRSIMLYHLIDMGFDAAVYSLGLFLVAVLPVSFPVAHAILALHAGP